MATLCDVPPGDSDTEFVPGDIVIDDGGVTVTVNVVVALVTPVPLAVTVTVWLFTMAAFDKAVNVTDPDVPVPGCEYDGVTLLGSPEATSVTLPVKLVRVKVMPTDCPAPPAVSVTLLDCGLAEIEGGGLTVKLTVITVGSPVAGTPVCKVSPHPVAGVIETLPV